MTAGTPEWPCEAYAPAVAAIGARCFLAELGERYCDSADHCHDVMAATRRRLFSCIQELAAAGDLAGITLAEAIHSPGQLFGGPE
jgi:hypothetical protein